MSHSHTFHLKQGLDLPLAGHPSQFIDNSRFDKTSKVAVTGADYIGMKPTMTVKEGDTVKIGQVLFSCKKNIGLQFTSPGAGKVVSINRGDKRVFQTVVVELAQNEEHQEFKSYLKKSVQDYSSSELRALLIESGAWTSIRQRPFDKVADVDQTPAAIFITAVDTHPHAPTPDIIIEERLEDFHAGSIALSKLTEGSTYICHGATRHWALPAGDKIQAAGFEGPHPAGNVSTHMHFLDPVNPGKIAWHVGYQDVIAIGHLLRTGQLDISRIVSVAGPMAKKPRNIKVRRGACLDEVIAGEVEGGSRVISGSVLHGRKSEGAFCFLGHYANQISAIEEDNKRELLGWHSPGFDRFSAKNIYVSKLMPWKLFKLGSNTNGSPRAIVPTGEFEDMTPWDILATPLLKALASKDTDLAQDLGCLELAEEDMALYTFVSSGKIDFGPILRDNLTTIEKEG